MPPPHFQSTAPSGSNAGSTSQANITSQISDLPKVHKHLVRDALQFIRQSLVTNDAAPSPTNKTTTAAYDAIRKLTSDPILQASDESTTSQTSRSRGTGSTATVNTESANIALIEATQLRKQVGSIITNTLSRIFSDEMDQDSKPLTQLLLSYIHALHSILDPKCIVLEWWDILIRPVMKDPHCNPSIARKAHQLVVWVMKSTPSSNYVDEPAPRAVWPAAPQSAIAAEHTRLPRQPGAAPYPASSTRAPSTSRSSEDGDARRSALFSTKINYGKAAVDPLRRFTERIFDLYTTEASSTGMRDIEDDDIKEVGIDQPSPSEEHPTGVLDQQPSGRKSENIQQVANKSLELDVVSTWKGNLEAIILTFGEEKPKAFFHHLAESFLEPSSRIPILLLLTIFFRISSLHAYHVVKTPFVRFLLMSLQLDTSKTAAALGAFALSTLIPHIPNWIANGGAGGLPALLSVLARIVDWRKLGPKWEDRENALVDDEGKEMEEWAQVQRISRRLNVRSDIQWKRLGTDSDNIAPGAPDAEKLFTFLYGIFPCNVIRFLRAPVDYLRKAEYESPFQADWDDIIDEIAVQNSSAPILRRHVLHPSLVDMDAESEITDKQRWREHDAADITAECVCLYIGGQFEGQELWLQSRRPSIIDHIPSLLGYRNSSGSASSIGGLTNQRIASGLVQAANAVALGEAYEGSQTPIRFFRKRSVSENLGRRGSVESPLVQQHAAGRRRDLSVQPGQHAGTAMFTSPKMMPFSPQTSILANEADIFLQNHIRLRYGHGTDRTPSGSAGDPLSRSSSIHSHLKTFNIARTNLSSTLMSPTTSQPPVAPDSTAGIKESTPAFPAEDTSAEASSPANQSRRSTVSLSKDGKNENTSPNVFNPVTSPIANRMMLSSTNDLLGSPALGMDLSKQTRSVLKEEVKQTIAYLKQENLQLRNELNYEIGQKDQMIRHIGRIHRDRIKDTVMEEERQNLYATLRSLRVQLRNLRSTQDLSKAETIASKNRHASWENELNAKLKAFREEKKVWANEVRQLQIVKEDYEALIQKLEGQLHDNANEVFELREQCRRDAKKVGAILQYEDKMQKMEECLRMWDDDMVKFDTQRRQIEEMSNRYEELAMLLDATEADRRRAENDEMMARRQAESAEKELRATQALLERQVKAEHSMPKEARETEGEIEGSEANWMLRRGSRARVQEDEEKERLRERVQRLEEELLEAKAQKEEWQMEELWKRLKGEKEKEESPFSDPHADHDVAPFELGQSQEETLEQQ